MVRITVLCLLVFLLASCRSTRKIRTAIAKKDTIATVTSPVGMTKNDSMVVIRETLAKMNAGKIDFTTFSGKVNVDYQSTDGKKYDVNANLRMYKDSCIWVSITAIFGIEGLRAYITRDSVKILNKQDKIYTARSVAYLKEITALPLDLRSLQDILIGNPVFIDSVLSYNTTGQGITLLSVGEFFRHLLTLNTSYKIEGSKLDDQDLLRSRNCLLSYSAYETSGERQFSTKRRIVVTEKKNLDIKLDFKSFSFNETLTFPFSVPKNYKTE